MTWQSIGGNNKSLDVYATTRAKLAVASIKHGPIRQEDSMAHKLHRTLLIASLLAGIGSFVFQIMEKLLAVFQFSHREAAVLICLIVIAFALGGLLGIALLRHGRDQGR